ncbi:MAG: HAD family phosphatase [Candidatus Nanopelagicales bacterium]
MPLSAVLFDMDGLLVDTEPLWLRAEHTTMAALGGHWSAAHQVAILGSSMPHAVAYMKRLAASDLPEADISALLLGSMLAELRQAEIPPKPGALALVREVAGSGMPFALVSASVRPIMDLVLDALARAGLPTFPVTVSGDDVTRGKPDPLPYLRAAELLGIDIGRAVVMEDSANGVRAAVAAGATVVAIPHVVPIQPSQRVIVRDSLLGLKLEDLRALVS